MYVREMFFSSVVGGFVISLFFLAGRLMNGMPFYEAFGKFWLAVLLIAFVNALAIGLGLFIVEIFSRRKQ